MDGVHVHDDLIEDYRRSAIDTHVSALAGFARRLDSIPVDRLQTLEQIEHQIVSSNIRARQFELEAIRSWERNPHAYADTLASSLAAQAIFTYAPETERARRVLSKLRQVPRLVQAARDNIKEPPAIFVKVGIDTWRGAMSFIDADLPRAFANVDDMHLLGDLADACTEAVQTIGAYVDDLENDIRPKAKGTFRLGRDRFEQKLRLEEGITLPTDRLLAIATRELAATQEEFRQLAGRLNGGDPIEAWRKAKLAHPEPGTLIATARGQLDELHTFLSRNSDDDDAGERHRSPLRRHRSFSAGRRPACGRRARSNRGRRARCITSPTSIRSGRPIGRSNTCATSTCRRCGRSRSTKSIQATSSTISSSRRWNRRSAARRCSRPRRTSKAGRTTASR